MEASRRGHTDMVRALLDAGARIDARESHSGATALIAAVLRDDAGLARLLLRAGADPEVRDVDGYTAEFLARHNNSSDVLRALEDTEVSPSPSGLFSLLVHAVCDPNKPLGPPQLPAAAAAVSAPAAGEEKSAATAVKSGRRGKAPPPPQLEKAAAAINANDVSALKDVLQSVADLPAFLDGRFDIRGGTLLSLAASNDNCTDCADVLIKAGANVNATNNVCRCNEIWV